MKSKRVRSTGNIFTTLIIIALLMIIVKFGSVSKDRADKINDLSIKIEKIDSDMNKLSDKNNSLIKTIDELKEKNELLKAENDTLRVKIDDQNKRIYASGNTTSRSSISRGYINTNNTQQQTTAQTQSTATTTDLRNKDLRVFEQVTVDQMNTWIEECTKYQPNSPFRNRGDSFILASNESGLDPRYIFAHACIESAYGTSSMARNKHNYFGIAAYDHSPESAYAMGDEVESGIINGAKWIADNFTNQGQYSLHLMIYGRKRYATAADTWINNIISLMRKCS